MWTRYQSEWIFDGVRWMNNDILMRINEINFEINEINFELILFVLTTIDWTFIKSIIPESMSQ